MLEIHPLADSTELNKYIEQKNLPQDTIVLRAYEGGAVTGNISFTIEGIAQNAVVILQSLEYVDDFTGELMVRAAISYAFNRSISMVKAPKSLNNEILVKIGFKTDEQNISINTKNVVHFCKK